MDTKEKEELLCSKYGNINRLLAIMNVEKQDREDLLHDIFINAFRSLDKLRDVEKMDAWLWSITRNEVNRHWRNVMKARETISSLDEKEYEVNRTNKGSSYLDLADELERIFDREELVQLLRRLPKDVLVLFRLHYFEGYKLSEIAKITGESENTVKSRHRRAIEKLKAAVEIEKIRQEKEERKENW